MRTEERFNQIKPKIAKDIFPARICADLLRIKNINIPKYPKDKHGIYIYSNKTATGKTLTACALLIEWEKERYLQNISGRGVFLSASELFYELKIAFTTGENIIDKYRKNTNLLVIDDLGDTKPSEWARQEFLLLLNYRYEHLLPTCFTSNMSLKDLEKYYGDERITSRIERMCDVLEKSDWRKEK